MSKSVLPQRIWIIGLGLMGGSLAAALRSAFPDYPVFGWDPNPESVRYAETQGWIQPMPTDPVRESTPPHGVEGILPKPLLNAFTSGDWIWLCAPLAENQRLLTAIAPIILGLTNTLVTDIGSCKRSITALSESLNIGSQFVGGHPITGKALAGIQFADPNLFQQAAYWLCPSTQHAPSPGMLQGLNDVIEGIGARPVIPATPAVHDHTMAWVSHFPHLYAFALANGLATQATQAPLIRSSVGPTLQGQLRVATAPEAWWESVFSENQDNLEQVLTAWRSQCDAMLTALREGKSLTPWLEQSRATAQGCLNRRPE
jgi:prephenate dehydrogenase